MQKKGRNDTMYPIVICAMCSDKWYELTDINLRLLNNWSDLLIYTYI